METTFVHPAFKRAMALTGALREHFPKSVEEAQAFEPMIRIRALSSRVLVVARTRVECAWCAYIDAVPGQNHRAEIGPVVGFGAKLDESVARVLFPMFNDVPYAD